MSGHADCTYAWGLPQRSTGYAYDNDAPIAWQQAGDSCVHSPIRYLHLYTVAQCASTERNPAKNRKGTRLAELQLFAKLGIRHVCEEESLGSEASSEPQNGRPGFNAALAAPRACTRRKGDTVVSAPSLGWTLAAVYRAASSNPVTSAHSNSPSGIRQSLLACCVAFPPVATAPSPSGAPTCAPCCPS